MQNFESLNNNYQKTLQYLYLQLPVFHNIGSAAYKPGFENTNKLMDALQHPHTRYKTIHVAGTNGKGSVSHYLSAILQTAGYKVGLYTSPHLVDFGERIRVDGQMIDQQYVIDFVERNKNLFDRVQPSFFEATMAMAFAYFADCEVDIAVIEVGLGGRLDSTNIISPEVSVITNISRDHTGFLGNTLAEIAAEKAGIIKPNTPIVIGETLPETLPVFIQKASKENAPLYFAEKEYSTKKIASKEGGKMLVEIADKNQKKAELTSGLSGIYQLKNIATVLTAIEVLNKTKKFAVTTENIKTGIANVVEITGLMGRWQILQENPRIVADTGHNEGGMTENVVQLALEQFENLHIVFGMVKDKDISAVLALLPKNATYYFTQAQSDRSMKSTDLQQLATEFNLCGISFEKIEDAVAAAKKAANTNDFIYIGGSNFVVGEALPIFQF